MRERVAALGGTLEIASAPGRGARLRARTPAPATAPVARAAVPATQAPGPAGPPEARS
jgi:signal transduction histidine kinase